MVENIAN